MGKIVFEDNKYYFVDEQRKDELFDYFDYQNNFSRLPMHSFEPSIDGAIKKAYGFLDNCFSQNAGWLVDPFFLVLILIIKWHMRSRFSVRLVCAGGDLKGVAEVFGQAIKTMHPDSEAFFVDNLEEVGKISAGDIFFTMDLSGKSLRDLLGVLDVGSSENLRIIAMTAHTEAELEGAVSYPFGILDVSVFDKAGIEECPPEKKKLSYKEIRSVATFAALERPIHNYELTKDLALIPYLFMNNYGCKVTVVGTGKDEQYPHKKYVQGVECVDLEEFSLECKLKWLREHGAETDLVMLFGTYFDNMSIAREYKSLNPEGRIYLALDINYYWADHIPRWNERVDELYSLADVITVSTEDLKCFVERKWGIPVEVVKCGYYHLGYDSSISPVYEDKTNTILTVGRIGSPEKRNDILLNSFAMICKDIPGWKLKLIGPVEDKFKGFIDDFFERFPELEKLVEFTGAIDDKKLLHEEFLGAKVFALSSESEGFPNVIPEAMSAGLNIVTTKVSNYKYFIAGGEIGTSSELDVESFSRALLTICKDDDGLRERSEKSFAEYLDNYDSEKIARNLYQMLCGEQ